MIKLDGGNQILRNYVPFANLLEDIARLGIVSPQKPQQIFQVIWYLVTNVSGEEPKTIIKSKSDEKQKKMKTGYRKCKRTVPRQYSPLVKPTRLPSLSSSTVPRPAQITDKPSVSMVMTELERLCSFGI